VSKEELLSAWRRINEWYGLILEGKPTPSREEVINAALFVMGEMAKRGIQFDENLPVVLEARNLVKRSLQAALSKDLTVIKGFVQVVGSTARTPEKAKDVDILIRANVDWKNWEVRVPLQHIWLPIRNALGKETPLHLIPSPHGPHGESIEIFDLVMKSKVLKRVVELGGGEHSMVGAINLDLLEGVNLEEGVPLPDQSVSFLLANHVLEHIQNKDLIRSEIERVLKPGGVAVLIFPDVTSAGQWVHPDHKTIWDVRDFSGCRIIYAEKIDRSQNGIPIVDQLVVIQKNNLLKPFHPPKPQMATYTEAFSAEEIKDWIEQHLPVSVEPKWNGFHAIVIKEGDRIRIYSEDKPDRDIADRFPNDFLNAFRSLPDKTILDGDIGIERKGKRLDRIRLNVLNSDRLKEELQKDDQIVFTFWDAPVLAGEDIRNLPYSERRKKIEHTLSNLPSQIRLTPIKIAKTFEEVEKLIPWASGFDKSEGAVLKDMSSVYREEETPDWAKVKLVAELKVKVLDREQTKAGTWKYRVGILPGDLRASNLQDGLVDLGFTHAIGFEAKPGDILTVRVRELIWDSEKDRLSGVNMIPVDVDHTRKTPYSAGQAMDLAERAQVLVIKALRDEGEPTRGEVAERVFAERWYELLPRKGEGRFVYHHHWRGLSEEETKLSDEELMKTSHSVHGDLRLEGNDALWGWAVLIGSTEENRKGDKFIRMSQGEDINIRLEEKLPQPKEWLEVGVNKPYVAPPGGVGSTSKTWSKIFAIDHGDYILGYSKQHFFEIFLIGKYLNGRFLIQAIPADGGKVVWNITKPTDKTPSLAHINVRDEIQDQRKKKRKFIVLAAPGFEPIWVNLGKVTDEEIQEIEKKVERWKESDSKGIQILKVNQEKQIVYGIVLSPGEIDLQGDIVSEEEIEKCCHKFMLESQKIFFQHLMPASAKVVESYIAPQDLTLGSGQVKKGAWVMAVKVLDSEIWESVKKGKITGFSIGGYGKRTKA
jgi:SAM-dependent methyltransferase